MIPVLVCLFSAAIQIPYVIQGDGVNLVVMICCLIMALLTWRIKV